MLVAPGDPDRPLSDDELLAKAACLLGVPETAPMFQGLLGLAGRPDVPSLRAALAVPTGR